jgi:hypothetical protein
MWLSGACRLSGVSLSAVAVGGCLLLVIRCRVSMSVVVVASLLLGVGCRVLIVDCWSC